MTKRQPGRPPIPDLRSKLVNAAEQAVLDMGVVKTTMSVVASSAGVSRQTAYRTFPGGRESVLEAVFARAALAFATRLRSQLASLSDPLDVLVESVLFSLRELPADPVLARALEHTALASMPGRFPNEAMSSLPNRIALDAYHELVPQISVAELDTIGELLARILLSGLLAGKEDSLTDSGPEPRRKLRTWLGPIVAEHQRTSTESRTFN